MNSRFRSSFVFLSLAFIVTGCGSSTQNNTVTSSVLDTGAIAQSVAFSPDEKFLAAGTFIAPETGDTVWLWDISQSVTQPKAISLKGHTNNVTSVAFSPDSKALATGSTDQTVRLWNTSQPDAPPTVLTTTHYVRSVAFSPNGELLAAGGLYGDILVWQMQQLNQAGNKPLIISGSADTINSLTFSPDGRFLAAASHDAIIYLWDVADLQAPPKKLQGHTLGATAVAFSPDSQTLASGGYHDSIRLWNVSDLTQGPTVFEAVDDTVNGLAFSPDGKQLASAYFLHKLVDIWSVDQPTAPPIELAGHRGSVRLCSLQSRWEDIGSLQ